MTLYSILNKENLKFFKENKWNGFFLLFVILNSFLLLFLGKAYTKFYLAQNIYLHDILNLIVLLLALPQLFKKLNRVISIEILLLIAFLYFLFSFWETDAFQERKILFINLRQFMLFGYLFVNYMILKKIASNKQMLTYLFKFIIIFAKVAVLLQVLYIVYILFTHTVNPLFKKFYYSPIIVMGIIIFAAYVLFFFKGLKKWGAFIFTFILSFTFGHDSAYLALIGVFFVWFFVASSKRIKIISIISFISIIGILFFKAPTFSDVNSKLRLHYWSYSMKKITCENYFLWGEGFGKPYFDDTVRLEMNNILNSFDYKGTYNEDKQYKTPPHNSFITLMHHVGGVGILLLLFPIIRVLKNSKTFRDDKKLFLLTSLIGMSIWSFFNVVLELPHSSNMYWIVFFTLIFYSNYSEKKPNI